VGDKINAPTLGNNYRNDIGGTSASAAAVSGAIAIIKEKNPALPVTELLKMLQDTSYRFKYSHATLGEQEGRRLKLCQDYRFNGRSYECGI